MDVCGQNQFWSKTSWDPDSNNDLDNHLAVLLKEAMILASPSAEDYSQYQHTFLLLTAQINTKQISLHLLT